MDVMHHVVILGGGFGGLAAAKILRRAPVRVTLIDRRNFHLFQPLLYQVATGGLSPANIATPLRAILKRQKNADVWLADAVGFDIEHHRVLLADGNISYDTLIVAVGARHHYFDHPEWESLAPGLKTIEDGTEMRHRILAAFEKAERETDAEARRSWLTFVIVGAGPTGVELAGALGELAHHTLRRNFRHINPADARILLLEGLPRVLPTFPEDLAAKAEKALARLGVTVRTGSIVVRLDSSSVTVERAGQQEHIPARTVLWAAGVQASPLAQALAQATGTQPDRAGRLKVEPNLSLAGHPDIFIIGDMACFPHQTGQALPGVAPVAIQQGRYVGRLVEKRLAGKLASGPFHYKDYGNLATIGRAAAVADLGWLRFNGFAAWLAWLFLHLIKLIGFQNRLLVLSQWAWNYFTRNRAARLITGEETVARRFGVGLENNGFGPDNMKAGPASDKSNTSKR
jgi:NADH dehydrogenase